MTGTGVSRRSRRQSQGVVDNAAFGLCLGRELYLLLRRWAPRRSAAAG
ncbi:hypothetical protein [Cellulomonas sp. P24]|jgi:hypothetical protein|nr:hypothetical protein [Cellulomonas sp. P24]MCR6494441.1 hypothetical protein [Cellulomonas sp. P24]